MAAKVNELRPLEKVEADFRTANDGGRDEWEVLDFRVSESIGAPYSGTIDIASRNRSVDFSLLLGKSCALEIRRGDRRRFFKGMIFRVEYLGANPVASVARIGFAAALWALHHGQDSRIFENRTAPEIIEEVLKEGLEPFGRKARIPMLERGSESSGREAASPAGKEYAKREYCVQYQESDLDFVQRLMVDEGLLFYFDQGTDGDKETVVVVDSNYAFPQIDTMGTKEVEEEEEESKERPLMDFATIGQSWTDVSPRYLRLRLHADGALRPAKAYAITLEDGSTREGKTTGDGLIVEKLPASARQVKVRLEGTLGLEEYSVKLSNLDPASRASGIEQRLRHLGLLGSGGTQAGDEVRSALTRFQERHGLETTGELDSATRVKLDEVHGS
jgi:hypothetical protein